MCKPLEEIPGDHLKRIIQSPSADAHLRPSHTAADSAPVTAFEDVDHGTAGPCAMTAKNLTALTQRLLFAWRTIPRGPVP